MSNQNPARRSFALGGFACYFYFYYFGCHNGDTSVALAAGGR